MNDCDLALQSHMTALGNVIESPIHVLRRQRKEVMEKVGLADQRNVYPAYCIYPADRCRGCILRARSSCGRNYSLFDEPTSVLGPELVGEVLGVSHKMG
jgi:ABC-type histidine transport system ATPase subunit